MWSRWTDSLVSCGRKADSCESDAVSKLSGFVWTGPPIAYQSRIAFLVIRLVKCQANGRCHLKHSEGLAAMIDARWLIFFSLTLRPLQNPSQIPLIYLQVRYLKIIEKSGYQALPWVRYITQNGGT